MFPSLVLEGYSSKSSWQLWPRGLWRGSSCVPVMPPSSYSCLDSSHHGSLLYMGLPSKTIQKQQLVQNARSQAVMDGFQVWPWPSLLICKLHWLPVGFQARLNSSTILAVTFKGLHGMGPRYLRDRLSPTVSAFPVCSGRVDALQVPSIKCCHLKRTSEV